MTFTVTSGGGTLSATSAATDSNGRASSTLTLGLHPRTNTVDVAVSGIQENQSFTAEGVRRPQTVQILSGNNQEGVPGKTLENPFVVEVRDQSDEPLSGVQVAFSVTAGGGTLSATSVTTDANGRAESTFTLGANPGANTVTVSVSGIQETQTVTAIAGAPSPVEFPDINLANKVRTAHGLPAGAAITDAKLAELTELEAYESNIRNLTGLEYAINLTYLNLAGNAITDISALTGLTNLTMLHLGVNKIADISAVTGLANLTWLTLSHNNISDISALAELTNLTTLDLSYTNITDISAVAGLTNLTYLNLQNNAITDISAVAGLSDLATLYLADTNISDISVVAGLTDLKKLGLSGNAIEDLSPLVANTGLGEGDEINVSENPLSSVSIKTHIPALQSRGVTVHFDNRAPHRILIISGSDQKGVPGETLAKPFVVEVQDENNVAFEGVPVTFSVTRGGGTLSATSVTTDANGRAESTLTLGANPGANTVTVSVSGIQEKQTFTAQGIRTPETLEIISGDDQEGLPGSALENPFVVEVRDQSDKPLPGAEVTFSVTAGGGTLSATSVTTDSDGRVASILTLGPDPGTNSVDVTVAGITRTETFTAEGIRTPKAFWIITGFDQTGYIGEALPRPIVIEVRDRAGERLPGVEVTFSVASGGGTLSVTSAVTHSNGRAESILTLGPEPGTNTVEVAVAGIQQTQTATAIAELPPVSEDVNRDDVVNVLDLVIVAGAIGAEGADLAADVNGDGIVNILDLVMVAGALEDAAAAPSADPRALTLLTATNVGQWLVQAQQFALTDATAQRGILFLEQLLAALTPKTTTLLPNYPNPFNPETWIAYQLAESANVTLTIFDTIGTVVRRFDLGHQSAGYYTARTRAAYWDGRNASGEPVASGLYFYQLATPSYRQLRRMVILK